MSSADARAAGARPPHTRPGLLVLVAAGGCVGATLRYAVAQVLPGPTSGWPTATFATNLVGALTLGLLLAALAASAPGTGESGTGGPDAGWRRVLRFGVGTGVVGAFTTYSTFVLEVADLARAGSTGTAVGYALATVAAGALLAAAGLRAGTLLGHRRGGEPLVTLLATVLVAAGGGLGAVGRFALDGSVTARLGKRRPAVPPGTLVVNALGALVLGVLAGLAPAGAAPGWLLFGGTGVCGGFTTFSTATVEAVRAAADGRWRAAWATAGAHLAVSLVAVALGLAVGLAVASST